MEKKTAKFKIEGTIKFDHTFQGVVKGEHYFGYSEWITLGEAQWRLKFRFPAKENCSLFLEHSGPEVEADFIFKIHSQLKEIPTHVRGPETFLFHNNDRGYMNVISADKLLSPSEGYALRGNVLVECNIRIPPLITKANTVSKDIRSLLFEDVTSDFVVRADEADYPVHKAILSARSPVFKLMFQDSMKEISTNYILIADFSAEIVKKFLTFLYTDDCWLTNTTETVDLCRMASQYEVKGLQQQCEENLVTCITVDSCIELLKFSDAHHSVALKESVLRFIKDNGFQVIIKHESHLVESLGSVLTVEMMKSIASK